MMPVIYRISQAAGVQSLDAADPHEYEGKRAEGSWAFTGRKYNGEWAPLDLKRSGKGASPDIWAFHNTLAMEDSAAAHLQLFVEQSGTMRFATLEGRRLTFLHITYALNCLDAPHTVWDRNVSPARIRKYAFHQSRVDWSLFKIPETHESEILTVQGLAGPQDEFKSVYEAEGLTGLAFEELYAW